MTAPFESDFDDNIQPTQPDIITLMPDASVPISVYDRMEGNYYAAGDDQPQPQPRPRPDNGTDNNNPFWGNWFSPVPRSLGGGLAIFQRTLANGPFGGNPYNMGTWPTSIPGRLFGRQGSSNPAAMFANPYSQLGNTRNNPLYQAANAIYLYNLMANGGNGGYSPWGGNGGYSPWGGNGGYSPWGGNGGYSPWGGGGYSPWANPYAAFGQGGNNTLNQIMTGLYLYNLMANGGNGGSPWGGGNPWGGNPWGGSPWGGNQFGPYGGFSPYNLLGSFGSRGGNNTLGQIANGLYLYNMLANRGNGYGAYSGFGGGGGGFGGGGRNFLNYLPSILGGIGALRSFGGSRLRF